MSVIKLADYRRCSCCNKVAKRITSKGGADIYRCDCGTNTYCFADIDWSVATDCPEDFTIAELREIVLDDAGKGGVCTRDRKLLLRVIWELVKMFIRGR